MKKYKSGLRRWSDQDIIDAIVAWNEKYGRPPYWREWVTAADTHPSSQTVRTRCGSWNDALTIAGFEPRANTGGRRHIKAPDFEHNERLRKKALRLREQDLSYAAIARELGTYAKKIQRLIGPRRAPVKPKRKPRNATERREQAIAALHKALEKQQKEDQGVT